MRDSVALAASSSVDKDQLIIKIVLIAVFAAFAVFLMLPARGTRHVAIRRLVMVLLLAIAVFAVVFPAAVNDLAHLVGVGRGTDLLLYGLIVVFVGNSIIVQRRHTNVEKQLTVLARRLAIMSAPAPAPAPADDAPEPREDAAVRGENSAVAREDAGVAREGAEVAQEGAGGGGGRDGGVRAVDGAGPTPEEPRAGDRSEGGRSGSEGMLGHRE